MPGKTPEPLPSYTLDEVRKHNSSNSAWIVIHSKVYDVTKFLKQHPGGDDILMDVAGSNATNDFEDIGHSQDAIALKKEHLIGILKS